MPGQVLEEQVAIITGGGRGIGQAIAARFAAEGAHVVIADVNADNAETAAKEIVSAGGSAIGVAQTSATAPM